MLNICILLCLAVCYCVDALSVHGSKTLVIYDDRLHQLDEFSTLFHFLSARSFDLEYSPLGNDSSPIDLYEDETRLYDNLIIFPTKGKTINRKLTVKKLLDFFNDGGDIFAITSPDAVAEPVRLFLNELGIYPSPKDTKLVDYFQETPNVVKLSSGEVQNVFVFESDTETDLIFEDSSVVLLDNREQIVPILAAPRTSFTVGKSSEPWASGSQGFLIAGFQSLKNSRVGWIGCTEFLKNHNKGDNGDFIQEFLKWNFREKGFIKIVKSSHSHSDGTPYEILPYKIKDTVTYEIGVSEWNGEKWVPFLADDLQFELKMIDPYYRLPLVPLKEDEETQYYTTGEFPLPDHHGVFTFQVDYKRLGVSFVSASDVRAIRHLAHDEYPRSWNITNSRVYLTTIFALIFAWILFVFLFISTSSTSKIVTGDKKNN